MIEVEVALALEGRQTLARFAAPDGATAREAVELSGLKAEIERDFGPDPEIGVFGRRVDWDDPLEDGDRIEFYRPLRFDPKDRRRLRALQGKSMARRARVLREQIAQARRKGAGPGAPGGAG